MMISRRINDFSALPLHGRTAAVALLLLVASFGESQAQQTFRACYVPAVGAMYLLDLPGLPTECLSQEHEEISWSEGTPSAEVEDGSVTTPKLADAAVTKAKISADAVDGDQVQDSVIEGRHLATNSVGPEQIDRWAVDSDELAPGSVYQLAMQQNAVSTGALIDQAITTEKIALGAVSGPRLGLGWTRVQEAGEVPAQGNAFPVVQCPARLEPVSSGWEIDWGLSMNTVELEDTQISFRVTNPNNAILDYVVVAYCADIR